MTPCTSCTAFSVHLEGRQIFLIWRTSTRHCWLSCQLGHGSVLLGLMLRPKLMEEVDPATDWQTSFLGSLFGRMLDNLKTMLAEKGVWDPTPWVLPVDRSSLLDVAADLLTIPTAIDIVWADDLALALRNASAGELVDDLRIVVADLFDWCHQFGMIPNTAKGKSEILLQLRGPQSRALRLELFQGEVPIFVAQPLRAPTVSLHIVPMYKHLGTHIHIGVKLLHDVRIRSGMMRAAYNKDRRKVYGNPRLGLRQRGQLLEAMIFSILRWNLGGWYELDDFAYKRYRTSLMSLMRRTCMTPHGPETVWTWSDDKVLATLGIPDPAEMLHLARLSFFTTAYHSGPDELWCLIIAEGSWMKCLRAALYWMYTQLEGSTNFSGLHEFETDWIQGVRTRGSKWRGWIKRAKTHSILQRENRSFLLSWHSDFYDRLSEVGLQMPPVTTEFNEDTEPHQFACGPCRQIFKSHTAWATHANKRHGRQDPLRQFLTDGFCKCCCSNYHTTRRLLAHLHYNRRCAYNHVALSQQQTIGPGRNSRLEDKDRDLPLPVVRPARKVYFLADEDDDIARQQEVFVDVAFKDKVVQKLNETVNNHSTVQDVERTVRDLLLTSVVSLSEAWDALVHIHNGLPHDTVAAAGLRQVFSAWSIQWLFADHDEEVTWPTAAHRSTSVSQIKSDLLMERRWTDLSCGPSFEIPRRVGKEVFIIHFYSGTRRYGDIQYWCEQASPPAGVIVTPISVDIVFDQQTGDLSDVGIQARWIDFISRAMVCAAYFGPPCSTWSVSRWRYYTEGDDGPRPTRSMQQPYGLPTLRLRELRDTLLGNILLLFSFTVLLLQLHFGRVCVIEHPGPRHTSTVPCIWTLQVFKHLRRFPGLCEVDVYQGHYGAISPKPTRLAISSVDRAKAVLDSFRTVAELPPALDMKRVQGQGYTTAQLKEYPPDFSRSLAALALEWLRGCHCGDDDVQTSRLTSEDLSLFRPFLVDLTGLFFRGADTRGRQGST